MNRLLNQVGGMQMLSKNEFEARLGEYLYGELSADQQQEVAEYLQAHPEAECLERDLRTLVEVGKEVAGIPLPEDMVPRIKQEVSAHLGRQTVEEAPRPQENSLNGKWVRWKTRPGRRRLFLSRTRKGLAALAAIAAVLTIYWFARELSWARVYAETISRLKRVHSFRVEGTILAPGGAYHPFRMWLQIPNRFRVEIGDPGQRRVVVSQGGQRLIFSEKDQRYCASDPGRDWLSWDGPPVDELVEKELGVPMGVMVTPQIKKEDRGDTTLYTATNETGIFPRKYIVEIHRPQHLVTRMTVLDRSQDQWVAVSKLSYADFNGSFPASLFDLTPPEGATPYTEAEAEALWYERSLTTESAIYPTTIQTATRTEDYTLEVWQQPVKDGDLAFSTGCQGGTCKYFAIDIDRSVIEDFQALAGYSVEIDDPILLRQVVPLKIVYRDGLPIEKRLAGLCELLGSKVVISPWQDSLVTEIYFEQDGRPIPASPCSTTTSTFRSLEDGRSSITGRCLPLEHFVTNVWGGSMINGSWSYSPAIMRRPPDPEADDPFATRIDVDYIVSRNWDENAAWLEEHFGVTGQIVQRPIRLRHIQVSPGLPTPDGVSSYSHYAVGQLEDCYPNPANPNTTIPFILKEAADVALRVFSDQGQLVRTVDLGKLSQGRHEVQWEGQDQTGQMVAAGTYLYRLEVNGIATSAKKVTLLR